MNNPDKSLGEHSRKCLPDCLRSLRAISDGLRDNDVELKDIRTRRKRIDEERVRVLASRLEGVEAKLAQANRDIGAKETALATGKRRACGCKIAR